MGSKTSKIFILESLAGLGSAFINMQIKTMTYISLQGYFINFIFLTCHGSSVAWLNGFRLLTALALA